MMRWEFIYQCGAHQLLTYKKSTNEFSSANNFIDFPSNWLCGQFFPDKNNRRYWIAADSGIAVYNAATKKLSYRDTMLKTYMQLMIFQI
jgi:hypothetical protein